MATAAGVHPATASRALNPETRLLVSEDTARRVSEAADRLGYRPNPVARSLRTRRSHSIGVLIPDLNNPLFPPIVRGLEDRLATRGYVALLGNTDADLAKEQLVFDQMRARHVDGFVLATAIAGSPIIAQAAESDLPVVLMNRTAQDYPFSSVSADSEAGERAAVAHMVALGHTRIGHIAGPQDISTGVERLRGFRAGMAAHHLPVGDDQIVYAAGYSMEEGLRCGRELLAARGDLTAIVVANDLLAVGCYGALDELGLDCPKDVSIIGFNDMPFIDRLRPPLSTVRFPHYQLGTEAATLLIERIETPDSPLKILFLAPELVVRGSTAPPGTASEAGSAVPLHRGATAARRGRG
ncbi:LacI family DNA-binding transcriptional regulator [Trebonia kvetii]|uniref:LacI family DNA-binding transcriptional regulator n=1 Tax=Trebonia kvetii TaxID=2480626 RepID=UPI001C9E43F0|nr:LacI family DNA-binding transcriptional regulator [Trebonia kvetii]